MGCSGHFCYGPYIPPGGGIGGTIGYRFCFSNNTEMIVKENGKELKRLVSDIKVGDLVLTLNGNQKVFSKVLENTKNEGIFEFYEIKIKDEKSNICSITVTGNHTMIIFEKENETKFKFANELAIGDILRTNNGLFKIFEIGHKKMNNSYKLKVEEGTVLANNILVSTIYLEGNKNIKHYGKVLDSVKIPIENKN